MGYCLQEWKGGGGGGGGGGEERYWGEKGAVHLYGHRDRLKVRGR